MLAFVINPDEEDSKTLWGLLGVLGWDALHAPTGEDALNLLAVGHRPDAVFCAAKLPDWDARDLLHMIHERVFGALIVTTEVEGVDAPCTGKVLGRPFGLEKIQEVLGTK